MSKRLCQRWIGISSFSFCLGSSPMALIKSLLAPIRRVAHFPLFQFIVTMASILWLQAADSNSVFGEIFSALDRLVDFSANQFAAFFEVRSFTRSWLTVGFMMGYVYLA